MCSSSIGIGRSCACQDDGSDDFPQHVPTATLNKQLLDQNKPAYLFQSAQQFPAYRSPVVIKIEQSLENTSEYRNYNLDQSLLNSPFYQPWLLHKCWDSQGFEKCRQYFTNREPHVNSRADDIHPASCYTQNKQGLEIENWISNRTFDSPQGLHSLNVPGVQRQFSPSDNTDFFSTSIRTMCRQPPVETQRLSMISNWRLKSGIYLSGINSTPPKNRSSNLWTLEVRVLIAPFLKRLGLAADWRK